MPSGVCSINYGTIRYISLEVVFFLIGVVLTSFARLVASMLGYSFILSTYLWPSLLISSLMYGTLRS